MSRKQPSEIPACAGSGRVGLMVFNAQPWGKAYEGLYNLMNQDCDVRILGFGSTQKTRTIRHPFTFEQRLEMVRVLHGDDFRSVQLVDIDSQVTTDDWVDYVLEKIRKMNLPEPTDYYTGSKQDAKWYTNRFARLDDLSCERLGPVTTYMGNTGKRIHILDRSQTPFPAATEVRSLIERRDDEWKRYVPARIVDYVDWHYPPEMRVAIRVGELPYPTQVPVGTRAVIGDSRDVYVLHDDDRWRPYHKP